MSGFLCARVYILDTPYQIDKLYDYFIPQNLRNDICAGVFAAVPFGNGNRAQTALVAELSNESQYEISALKPVKSVMSDGIILNKEQLALVEFLKDRTFCTTGDAVRAIVPVAALAGMDLYYIVNEEFSPEPEQLNSLELRLLNFISDNGRTTSARIRKELGEEADEALATLMKKRLVKRDFEFHESKSKKYIRYLSVSAQADLYISGEKKLRSEKQLDILRFICECGKASDIYVKKELDASAAQIKALISKGLVLEELIDRYRNPYEFPNEQNPQKKLVLNDEQQKAKEKLYSLYKTGAPRAALLHGITGSGKTSVIKAMTDEVLADGRQVIILVPEISLTPQTLSVFGAYYGDNIAVMHSSLSQGERYDAYRRMQNGTVNVCIGTRSAIFAPFERLGMIVIDEEQEHTYKSENNPKYSALDVASFRCGKNNALMLLASATPSVGSYYKACEGKYSLIELNNRYGDAKLPEAVICDMREEFNRGSLTAVGSRLRQEISKTMEKGEQAVIFLNRRGYSNYASCPQCGEVIMCPHCSVSLTRHNYISASKLVCHYCGYSIRLPDKCPSCQGEHIQYMGYGTQKVEEELCRLFPDNKIMRMDADTTSAKFSYDELLGKFRAHEADILLGTQMVTKGHDFPDVTLSGVLLADMSLYLDDYRAGERTFSLITQVIGRAGRQSKPGKAVIQTFNPEHPVLRLAAAQDYKTFYTNEIALRKSLVFPPFCDIFLITVTSRFEDECITVCRKFFNELKALLSQNPDIKLIIFGPFEAPIYKLNEKFRWRFVIKGKSNKATRGMFSYLIKRTLSKSQGAFSISIDVNPNNI